MPHSAEVVDHCAVGYRADAQLVDQAVDKDPMPLPSDLAVALACEPAGPVPASVRLDGDAGG